MIAVVFRPEAEADLLAIALYIAEDSPERARRFTQRLRERCERLADHPHLGRPRPELGDDLRSLSERPYVLLYRATDTEVEIVAILHGARDLPSALAGRIEDDKP